MQLACTRASHDSQRKMEIVSKVHKKVYSLCELDSALALFASVVATSARQFIVGRVCVCVLSVTVFSMNSILKLNFDSSFDTRRQPRIKQEVMCCEEMSWQKCNFTKRRDCNTKMCQNRNSQNASGKKLSVEERETG